MAPIPSLLLTAAVHEHLVREKTRTRVGLVVESGDAREVHHIALLIGFGASAVNPYLAFETIDDMIATGPPRRDLPPPGPDQLHQGGLQGRHQDHVQDGRVDGGVVHRGPDLRGGGTGPRRGRRVLHRHGEPHRGRRARRARPGGRGASPPGASRHGRPSGRIASSRWAASTSGGARGRSTSSTRKTVFKLQHATRAKRYDIFKEYTKLVDDQSDEPGDAAGAAAAARGSRSRRCRSTRSSRSRRS